MAKVLTDNGYTYSLELEDKEHKKNRRLLERRKEEKQQKGEKPRKRNGIFASYQEIFISISRNRYCKPYKTITDN